MMFAAKQNIVFLALKRQDRSSASVNPLKKNIHSIFQFVVIPSSKHTT
jgi:hypothetical protein